MREESIQGLQRISDAALAYLSLDDLLAELLNRVAEILHSDTAAFLELDERSEHLVARAAKGIEEEVQHGVRIPLGRGFAGRVAASASPVTIEDVDHADVLNPLLREKGIRSLLGVPLIVEGRVIGVLHVGTLTPRVFTPEDRDLLQLAADRAALAIDHGRLLEQRRMVESLQRTLLPDELPQVPGLEIAARYVPAVTGESIGGDWYDAFRLGGGRIGLVIGDVMGSGMDAAMLMAQLRTALRAYALDGHGPGATADRLSRLLRELRPAAMTTLAYGMLDAEEESLTLVNAGHLPPVLVPRDAAPTLLEAEPDPPLGVTPTARYHEHRFPVPTGSTLVMVTDGAVEVRGEALDEGLRRLGEAARGATDIDALCRRVARGEMTGRLPADDLAVLATRSNDLPDRLTMSWPASAGTLGTVRHLLRRWLQKWGARPDEVYDITVAVQEACANAIEHAYAPGGAAYDVDASYDGGRVRIAVHDRGHWRPPRGVHRGRGMPIMETLMERVEVESRPGGTTVVLERTLGRGAEA